MTDTFAYPFDPTGKATTNLISNEIQTISLPDWTDFYFFVPKLAPFFRESLKIVVANTGKVLVDGVDYVPSHYFYEASLQCASTVYGSVTLLDRTIQGVISITYQTIGGEWTVDNDTIETILSNVLIDPRVTTWEMVVEIPEEFPPISHAWDIVDITGASDIVTALNSIYQALEDQSGSTGLAAHLSDYGNPHKTTAAQVGLGNVQNYGIADTNTATAGTDNSSYMTPIRTAQAITIQVGNALSSHITNTNNPHQTSAAQVGLGNVQNYPMASSSESQSGTVSNRYMSPLNVSQAISSQVGNSLNSHISNVDNPHQTSAAQVGLGNVQNYGIADSLTAQAGTADNAYMTPLKTSQAISSQVGQSISNHVSNINNPHQTTKAQVGLGSVQNFGIASTADAQAGTADNLYMTPLKTFQAISALSIDSSGTSAALNSHITNTNNPHQTTATQVGLGNVQNYGIADTNTATAGTADNLYMTPLKTSQAISSQVGNTLNSHISNTNNPHQTSAAQVGLGSVQNFGIADTNTATAGTADNLYMTPLKTSQAISSQVGNSLNSHISNTNNPHQTTKTQVGLGSVQNYGIASTADAQEGTSNTLYMTPLNVSQAISSQVGNSLNSHISNTNNPHQTTAAQVGTYTSSQIDTNISSSINTGFTRRDYVRKYGGGAGDVYTGVNTTKGLVSGQNDFVDYDSIYQYINVIQSTDNDSTANNILTNYSKEYRNFMRISSYDTEPRYAIGLNQWSWDNTNSLIVCSQSNNAIMSALSPFKITGSYSLEIELSSTDNSDQAIGICAAFTSVNGTDLSLTALRTPGGFVSTGNTVGFPGAGIYELFSVGYNLAQTALNYNHTGAVNMGSNSNGLIWGDGVSNTNRSSTPYIPQSQTSGTNGWSSKGSVRIKLTVDIVAQTLVLETTNFGSTTYVDSAKVVIDLTDTTNPQTVILANAIKYNGVRWGLSAINQPNAKFKIISAPDQYRRYIKLNQGSDGTDSTVIKIYNGSTFVTNNLIDTVYSQPGKLIYSDLNQKLYSTRRDGSLQSITLA